MPPVRSGHLNTHCQEGSPRGLRGAAQEQKVKVGAGPGCSREAPAAGGGGAPGGARHVGLGRPIRAETRPEELVSVNEGCHSGCSRPNAECRGLCASCGLRCRRRGRTSLAGGSWALGAIPFSRRSPLNGRERASAVWCRLQGGPGRIRASVPSGLLAGEGAPPYAPCSKAEVQS